MLPYNQQRPELTQPEKRRIVTPGTFLKWYLYNLAIAPYIEMAPQIPALSLGELMGNIINGVGNAIQTAKTILTSLFYTSIAGDNGISRLYELFSGPDFITYIARPAATAALAFIISHILISSLKTLSRPIATSLISLSKYSNDPEVFNQLELTQKRRPKDESEEKSENLKYRLVLHGCGTIVCALAGYFVDQRPILTGIINISQNFFLLDTFLALSLLVANKIKSSFTKEVLGK